MSDRIKIQMGCEEAEMQVSVGITETAFRAMFDQLETTKRLVEDLYLQRFKKRWAGLPQAELPLENGGSKR